MSITPRSFLRQMADSKQVKLTPAGKSMVYGDGIGRLSSTSKPYRKKPSMKNIKNG